MRNSRISHSIPALVNDARFAHHASTNTGDTTMTTFTTDNTQGFTPAELGVLNAAFDQVWAMQDEIFGGDGDDWGVPADIELDLRKSLVDAMNDAWRAGMTTADLVAALPTGWTKR
jgi:hypothetical protein